MAFPAAPIHVFKPCKTTYTSVGLRYCKIFVMGASDASDLSCFLSLRADNADCPPGSFGFAPLRIFASFLPFPPPSSLICHAGHPPSQSKHRVLVIRTNGPRMVPPFHVANNRGLQCAAGTCTETDGQWAYSSKLACRKASRGLQHYCRRSVT